MRGFQAHCISYFRHYQVDKYEMKFRTCIKVAKYNMNSLKSSETPRGCRNIYKWRTICNNLLNIGNGEEQNIQD